MNDMRNPEPEAKANSCPGCGAANTDGDYCDKWCSTKFKTERPTTDEPDGLPDVSFIWDNLKRASDGHKDRRQTDWGTKTKHGFALCMRRLVDEADPVRAHAHEFRAALQEIVAFNKGSITDKKACKGMERIAAEALKKGGAK